MQGTVTLFLNEIKYLVFIFDLDGCRPDPENFKAINQMPPPKNISIFCAFLVHVAIAALLSRASSGYAVFSEATENE